MVRLNKPGTSHKFAVAIPTRNRNELLVGLLENLNSVSLIPSMVFVIDSSDEQSEINFERYRFPVQHVFTKIKSAALQRNIALDLICEQRDDFNIVSFLDDDVRIDSEYFGEVSRVFDSNPDCVGVSGLALVKQAKDRGDTSFRRLIGLSGKPCTISKSIVNIPAPKGSHLIDAEWLIGCSNWNLELMNPNIRFEEDFMGQSIFEDVIFSWRCRDNGRLICSTNILLTHLFSSIERPNDVAFYRSWVKNRYRFFKYDEKRSKKWFWFLNLILIVEALIGAVFRRGKGFKKAIGIIIGSLQLLSGINS